jgi:Flp pilus assembly pilin Flp
MKLFFRGLIPFFSNSIGLSLIIFLRFTRRQERKTPARTGILRGNNAQAVTEYIMIVTLIALTCMAGAKIFQIGLVNAFRHFILVLQIPVP